MPASSSTSTARQVVHWLMLVSMLIAVVVMGVWWIASDISTTPSTMSIFAFATIGLWMMIYQLFVFAIKQLVKDRIAQQKGDRA